MADVVAENIAGYEKQDYKETWRRSRCWWCAGLRRFEGGHRGGTAMLEDLTEPSDVTSNKLLLRGWTT